MTNNTVGTSYTLEPLTTELDQSVNEYFCSDKKPSAINSESLVYAVPSIGDGRDAKQVNCPTPGDYQSSYSGDVQLFFIVKRTAL